MIKLIIELNASKNRNLVHNRNSRWNNLKKDIMHGNIKSNFQLFEIGKTFSIICFAFAFFLMLLCF